MKKRILYLSGGAVLLLCALVLLVFLTPLRSFLFGQGESLISAVEPAETVFAAPGARTALNVTAKKDAAVTVALGSNVFQAAQTALSGDEDAVFTALITFPTDKTQLALLDRVHVTATRGKKTATVEGPRVVMQSEEMTTELPSIGNQINADTAAPTVNNHVLDEIDDFSTDVEQTPLAANGQLCMVVGGYADTWNADPNDDTFFPENTTLAPGTLDFAVGQSQVYDASGDELRNFYILSSGRKVRTDAVQLLSAQKPNTNSLRVTSSTVQNGALIIRMKTSWNVPYDFSISPQSYYAGNSEKFNVSAFTASQIAFTFQYTNAAQGTIDVGANDVVSSAAWSVDTQNNTATLTMTLRQTGKYYGYTLQYGTDNTLTLTIKRRPKSLSGSVIVLDPGHGGNDSGALGFSGAVQESQLNFALAVAAKYALERHGATVYLTRTGDTTMSLEERKAFARQVNPDLFLSIHCNAAENPARYGTAVYYYRPMSQPLAAAIYTQTLSVFQNIFYAGSAKRAGAGEGLIFHPFSVTRLEECPSVLIETGFITNYDDCVHLLDAGNRDKIAEAIAAGIANYLS